jgi:hypothetical protein
VAEISDAGSQIFPAIGQIWHVGFLVDDLDRAMIGFQEAFGLHWGEPRESGQARVVFSTDIPIAIELIEAPREIDAPPPAGSVVFDHLGYWASDMALEQNRLESCGFPSVHVHHAGGFWRATFHRGPGGVRLEACNVAAPRDGMDHFTPTPAA